MLVLTRREGTALLIGENIEITVVEVQGDKVKLGVTAPRSVTVLRRELVDEAKELNREAAGFAGGLDELGEAFRR